MPAIITPPGLLSYPHFFKPRPRSKTPGAEAVYSCVLLLTEASKKTEAYKALIAAVNAAGKSMFPEWDPKKRKTYKSPIRLTEDEDKDFPDEVVEFFNCWTREKPGIVDAANNDILSANDIWPGQLARVSVQPFAYDQSGNKGVGLYLHNVQILKSAGMKRLDGKKAAHETFGTEYADAADEDNEVPFEL